MDALSDIKQWLEEASLPLLRSYSPFCATWILQRERAEGFCVDPFFQTALTCKQQWEQGKLSTQRLKEARMELLGKARTPSKHIDVVLDEETCLAHQKALCWFIASCIQPYQSHPRTRQDALFHLKHLDTIVLLWDPHAPKQLYTELLQLQHNHTHQQRQLLSLLRERKTQQDSTLAHFQKQLEEVVF